jgi:hypothetical protein
VGERQLLHTAHRITALKELNDMTTPRPLVLLAIVIASIIPAMSVSAQNPQQTDEPVPPAESEVPPAEPGEEIVHSWALAPAGNEDGAGGNRSQLSYTADPGTVLEDAVTLFNLSNVPLVFRIYGTDAVNNPDDGGFEFLPSEEVPTGAGSWVDFGAEQVTLDAFTQATIPVKITIPENTAPGDYIGGLLASNATLSVGEDGQQITLDRRTGTRLAVRVNGPLNPELRIENVQTEYDTSLNPFGGSATVTYTITNLGNTLSGATVDTSVSGPFGLGKQTSEPRDLPEILPGTSLTFTEEFDGVPALGAAVGRVELTPAGENSSEIAPSNSQSMALAIPIVVVLGLLALVFGLLALRAFARHRNSDENPGPPPTVEAVADREPEHQPT